MSQRTEDAQEPRAAAQQDGALADPSVEAAAPSAGGDAQAELQAARAEAAEYKDKYLREYADRENFRKRQERVTADRAQYAKRSVIDELLVDVVDNFDHAARHTEAMDVAALRQTLKMLQGQLNRVLAAQGVTPVEVAPGQSFDPHLHEAVESVASDLPEGTIVEEARKGYMMGGDLLRPARVTVSAGKRD